MDVNKQVREMRARQAAAALPTGSTVRACALGRNGARASAPVRLARALLKTIDLRTIVVTDRSIVVLDHGISNKEIQSTGLGSGAATILAEAPLQPLEADRSNGILTVTIGTETVRLPHNEYALLQAALEDPSS